MHKYPVNLHWSDEDDAWIAVVPDLPGCMADGATEQEALREAAVAVKLWLSVSRKMGHAIPEPTGSKTPSGKFVARVPKSLHRQLQLDAKRENVSLNQLVVNRLSMAR